jgi:glutamate-1-semialdehyde 2,1-aminomutase
MEGLKDIFDDNSIPAVFSGHPAMFSFAVGIEKPTCQREWSESERDYYLRLVEAALERGVMPDLDSREPWFLCYSHSDADIDETLNVFADVVKMVKR